MQSTRRPETEPAGRRQKTLRFFSARLKLSQEANLGKSPPHPTPRSPLCVFHPPSSAPPICIPQQVAKCCTNFWLGNGPHCNAHRSGIQVHVGLFSVVSLSTLPLVLIEGPPTPFFVGYPSERVDAEIVGICFVSTAGVKWTGAGGVEPASLLLLLLRQTDLCSSHSRTHNAFP